MKQLTINPERLWDSLMSMAEIGATPAGGVCRLALTDEDRQGRDLFIKWARKAGCQIEIDQMGNIIARRSGADDTLPPVMTGSHLDSQPTGGKFDGVYGVLAGLEVVRALNDQQVVTQHPIEVVVWTNEEGSRFTPAMVASGVFAGEFSLDYGLSRQDFDGITLGQELDRIGYAGSRPCGGQPVKSYFEAHIEQGPILEDSQRIIGLVQGIQGMRWYTCKIEGMASHAGTTPMPARHDALLGASTLIQAVHGAAELYAPDGRGTVGQLVLHPNSPNVVPGRVDCTIDLRHPDAEVLQNMAQHVRQSLNQICNDLQLSGALEEIWYAPPTSFHPDCIATLRRATKELNLANMDIISGAGHDAKYLAQVCPTAMLFIPCKDGISHNEIEAADKTHVANGCHVLLKAIAEQAIVV